ncbi:hypothetical protein [Pontibacter sp. G13]|uniref:hypothetical protein n=1 Tax=Pontibacter sp. G13 TaxID=3074898 RepID=UPI002889DE5D|nr:hypothetical protein [Pontibacter sp. G13]WNJ16193.1 hypothetical protein RJD25_15120 [Pontibacter sp. G13]
MSFVFGRGLELEWMWIGEALGLDVTISAGILGLVVCSLTEKAHNPIGRWWMIAILVIGLLGLIAATGWLPEYWDLYLFGQILRFLAGSLMVIVAIMWGVSAYRAMKISRVENHPAFYLNVGVWLIGTAVICFPLLEFWLQHLSQTQVDFWNPLMNVGSPIAFALGFWMYLFVPKKTNDQDLSKTKES